MPYDNCHMRYVCGPLPNPLARTANVDLVIASSKSKWIKFISANLLFGTFWCCKYRISFLDLAEYRPRYRWAWSVSVCPVKLPTGQHSAAEFGLVEREKWVSQFIVWPEGAAILTLLTVQFVRHCATAALAATTTRHATKHTTTAYSYILCFLAPPNGVAPLCHPSSPTVV